MTHHPILFRPVQRLTDEDPATRIVYRLVRHGIAVYSPHTAFDGARGGINQMLAEAIGLRDVRPIEPASQPAECKVVVFVPQSDLEPVLQAMFDQGAGVIGDYRECSFRVAGKGTFFGTESTSPTVGQKGRREEVEEWRVEVICPAERVEAVVRAMKAAHSYEEPAFDVYPLAAQPDPEQGAGRMGRLPEPEPLADLARRFGRTVATSAAIVVGDPQRRVERVAIACGAGDSFVRSAHAAGADVLLTGEARFHQQLEARERGLALVLVGHYEIERFGVERLARRLQEAFPQLTVTAAAEETPAWLLPVERSQ